ncbi:MAG: hypothetical protein HKL90_02530, partial [Elusimicrobia bacterium]|nr:hypothetical protein [Elusimicrobiota bacterium]
MLLIAAACGALATRARAAAVSWVGGVDQNWSSAANWSSAQVPTSADDVVIDTNAAVVANSAISFQSLTLGDPNGSAAATLTISSSVASGGGVTVDSGATLVQNTTVTLTFASVNVAAGGVLTHAANGATRTAVLNLNVTGDFN